MKWLKVYDNKPTRKSSEIILQNGNFCSARRRENYAMIEKQLWIKSFNLADQLFARIVNEFFLQIMSDITGSWWRFLVGAVRETMTAPHDCDTKKSVPWCVSGVEKFVKGMKWDCAKATEALWSQLEGIIRRNSWSSMQFRQNANPIWQ